MRYSEGGITFGLRAGGCSIGGHTLHAALLVAAVVHFLRHHLERLQHIRRVLRRRLHKLCSKVFGQRCSLLRRNLPVAPQIYLVAYEQFADSAGGELVDFLNPHLHGVEAFLVGDIVHDHNPVRALVVRAGDGLEPLLPCCVPLRVATDAYYLQLYRRPVQIYRLYLLLGDLGLYEVNADGAEVILTEDAILRAFPLNAYGEPEKQRRLPDRRTSNDQQLEQVVTKGDYPKISILFATHYDLLI